MKNLSDEDKQKIVEDINSLNNYDDIGHYLDKIKEFGNKDWQERIFKEGAVFKDDNEFKEYVVKIIKMFNGMKQEHVKLLTEFINKLIFTLQYQEVAEETLREKLSMVKSYLEGKDASLMGMIHGLDLSKLPKENLSDDVLNSLKSLEKIKLNHTIYNPYADKIRKVKNEYLKKYEKATNSKEDRRLPLYKRALELLVKSQEGKINLNRKQSLIAANEELKGIKLNLYEEVDLNFYSIYRGYCKWIKKISEGKLDINNLGEIPGLEFYKDYSKTDIQDYSDKRIKRKKLTI